MEGFLMGLGVWAMMYVAGCILACLMPNTYGPKQDDDRKEL